MDPLHRICFVSLLLAPLAVTAADNAGSSASTPAQTSGAASAPANAAQTSQDGNSAKADATQAQQPADKNPLHAMTPEQEFSKLDADGNGKITAKEAEVDENLVEHFDKVAQDDTVNKIEYMAWLNSGTAGMSHNWPLLNSTAGTPSYEDEFPPSRRMQPQPDDPNMSDPMQPASAE